MCFSFLSFQTSQYSKLEKADILEMTVKHLRSMQRQQLALAAATDNTVVSKYRAGFQECAQEVTRYLGQVDGLHPQTQGRLLQHLTNCLQRPAAAPEVNHNQVSHPNLNIATSPPMLAQPLHVSIPTATTASSLPGAAAAAHTMQQQVPIQQPAMQQVPIINAVNAQGVPQLLGTFQVVPGSVVGSDVTFLLSAPQMCSTMTSPNSTGQSVTPSVSPSSTRSSPTCTVSRPPSAGTSPSSSSSSPASYTTSPTSYHYHPQHQQQQLVYSSPALTHHVTSRDSLKSSHSQPVAPPKTAAQHMPMKEEQVWRPW